MFDLWNTARAATTSPNRVGLAAEAFVFVACIYFVSCFARSHYSQRLERRLDRAVSRTA
jgi:general L-amino acid transport system permease protein